MSQFPAAQRVSYCEGESMNRVLKAAGLVIGGIACVGVSAASYMVLRKPASAPALDIKVEMTPERIARGKYIFTVSDCTGCHSGRDFGRFGGPVVEGQIGQGMEFPKEMG